MRYDVKDLLTWKIWRATIRRRVRNAQGHAARLSLDVEQRVRRQSDLDPPEPARDAGAPTGACVMISHFRPDVSDAVIAERTQLLERTLRSVLELPVPLLVVGIVTNDQAGVTRDLSAIFGSDVRVVAGVASDLGTVRERRIVVTEWHPGRILRSGYYMSFAHKRLLRAAHRNPLLSHFVYIEDDLDFTSDQWEYWCRYRAPLAEHGLLPGLVRFESFEGDTFVVDQTEPLDPDARPGVELPALDRRFVNLPNPHQALYVFDRPMATYHLTRSAARSPFRSRAMKPLWGIIERSAIGPMFDRIPPGFTAMSVVATTRDTEGVTTLDPACLIEHTTGNYSRSPTSNLGKLPVRDLFVGVARSSDASTRS